MASFNISKGLEKNLPTTKIDGNLYFCTDTGNMYIDYQDGNVVSRKLVNKDTIDAKANSADIVRTVSTGTAVQNVTYWKVSNFGNWGTGAWYEKGFSMLLTSRAGEMIWVSLAANDSATSAEAIRLFNRYSKMASISYSVSESAIYITAAGWSNNICAHILSNINGDYVPTISQASALPADAVAIPITEMGPNSDQLNIGCAGSKKLNLSGSTDRPLYNSVDLALKSDVDTHTFNKSNPHEVSLTQLGVTATAAELNKMDGVTASTTEINKLKGLTATTTELNYVSGVTSAIQTQLNGKQASITGAATTITGSNLTANRAIISNSSGKVAVSAVTSTELGYLDGVTSAIQTQLDGKVLKSGDTMTGSLTIGEGRDLCLQATAGSADSGDIIYRDGSGAEIGRLWITDGNISFRNSDGAVAGTILHTQNYTTHLDGRYVNTAGDTMSGELNMNNNKINNIGDLTFADPGPNEGITWTGGNGWYIFESPDDLTTNTAGNLQFTHGNTRRLTLRTNGTISVNGTLELANGTWNKAGDDAYFGDNNTAGSFAIKGQNGYTNLKLVSNEGDSCSYITYNQDLQCLDFSFG